MTDLDEMIEMIARDESVVFEGDLDRHVGAGNLSDVAS